MGILDLYAAQAGINEQPLQALPRTLGERLSATAGETFAPDRYFNITGARRDLWQRSVDELHAATGQTYANPYGPVTSEEMMRLGNQPAITEERSNKIIEASRAARAAGNDNLFDPENIDRYIGEESNRRRQLAGSYEGTGNGIGNFLGGAAMSSIEPLNVLALGVPVSRLPLAAAKIGTETFLRNVGREAAVQAGVNTALQAGTEALDYSSRSEVGTAPSAGEIATNIAGAAVLGGVIGGGVRALHLKLQGLHPDVLARAPLEVRDAARVVEEGALYSGQNRLGIPWDLHERYQGNAMDAVLRGKPVTLDELGRTADTPMTALGTILGQRTDRAEINPLMGTPDEGMRAVRDAFARTAALPDSEIEAFARETRPTSFTRLDRVESQLQDAQARLSDIQSRTPSAADILDPDTALRLQDIEADLAKPGLRRQRRDQLEQEREMIMSTVDPRDRLPAQAEKAQREQAAAVRKEIDRLASQREEARATADQAVADLKRKLGRYADEFQPQAPNAIAQDFGMPTDAELGQAIQRADVMRQARMVREILPPEPIVSGPPKGPTGEPAKAATTAEETERAAAVEKQATSILEDRGRIGEYRAAATKELEAADIRVKDARAALGCAQGAI